jgi:hypothetical protein
MTYTIRAGHSSAILPVHCVSGEKAHDENAWHVGFVDVQPLHIIRQTVVKSMFELQLALAIGNPRADLWLFPHASMECN